MIKKLLGPALLAACLTTAAQAQTLTFEGIDEGAPIGNYYNGGGGPAYGVNFVGPATAIISEVQPCEGGSGFTGQPSGCGAFSLFGFDDARDTPQSALMNRALGFVNAISFYYASPNFPTSITLFSGVNLTGSQLGSLMLPLTASASTDERCGEEVFCPFSFASLSFAGVAQSVLFSGANGNNAFDDVTFTAAESVPPTTTVPEPATYVLMGLGLGLVGIASRRRRRSI